jgi:hypothetical protein
VGCGGVGLCRLCSEGGLGLRAATDRRGMGAEGGGERADKNILLAVLMYNDDLLARAPCLHHVCTHRSRSLGTAQDEAAARDRGEEDSGRVTVDGRSFDGLRARCDHNLDEGQGFVDGRQRQKEGGGGVRLQRTRSPDPNELVFLDEEAKVGGGEGEGQRGLRCEWTGGGLVAFGRLGSEVRESGAGRGRSHAQKTMQAFCLCAQYCSLRGEEMAEEIRFRV